MSTALEKLLTQLKRQSSYQPMTESEITKQADAKARAAYEERSLAARQDWQNRDAELLRQMAALEQTYNDRRAQSDASYQAAINESGRALAGRGMQRSSYGSANHAVLAAARAAAGDAISAGQARETGEMNARRTLLANQLAELLQQYDQTRRSDAAAAAQELRDREDNRSRDAANLLMKLYEYQSA